MIFRRHTDGFHGDGIGYRVGYTECNGRHAEERYEYPELFSMPHFSIWTASIPNAGSAVQPENCISLPKYVLFTNTSSGTNSYIAFRVNDQLEYLPDNPTSRIDSDFPVTSKEDKLNFVLPADWSWKVEEWLRARKQSLPRVRVQESARSNY